MTVAELIRLLQTFPQNAPVAYRRYSEQKLLEAGEITLEQKCLPRLDGWVQDARPDMPTQLYLLLPGN